MLCGLLGAVCHVSFFSGQDLVCVCHVAAPKDMTVYVLKEPMACPQPSNVGSEQL
jgi:hypothetical protein